MERPGCLGPGPPMYLAKVCGVAPRAAACDHPPAPADLTTTSRAEASPFAHRRARQRTHEAGARPRHSLKSRCQSPAPPPQAVPRRAPARPAGSRRKDAPPPRSSMRAMPQARCVERRRAKQSVRSLHTASSETQPPAEGSHGRDGPTGRRRRRPRCPPVRARSVSTMLATLRRSTTERGE